MHVCGVIALSAEAAFVEADVSAARCEVRGVCVGGEHESFCRTDRQPVYCYVGAVESYYSHARL